MKHLKILSLFFSALILLSTNFYLKSVNSTLGSCFIKNSISNESKEDSKEDEEYYYKNKIKDNEYDDNDSNKKEYHYSNFNIPNNILKCYPDFQKTYSGDLKEYKITEEQIKNMQKDLNHSNKKNLFVEIKNIDETKYNLNLDDNNEVEVEEIVDDNVFSTSMENRKYLRVLKFNPISSKYSGITIKKGKINGIEYDKLKKGDLICCVNGKKLNNLSVYELEQIKKELKNNKKCVINFLRQKQNSIDSKNDFKNDFKDDFQNYKAMICEFDENTHENDSFIATKLSNMQIKSDLSSKKSDIYYIKIKKGIDYNCVNDLLENIKFYFTTYEDLNLKEQIGEILIDLRDCSGGFFGAAQKLATEFVGFKFPLTSVKYLSNDSEFTDYVVINKNKNPLLFDNNNSKTIVPVNILINENTSDAALHLAYILKKCRNATIFGDKHKNLNLQIERELLDLYKNEKKTSCVSFPKIIYKTGNENYIDYLEGPIKPDFCLNSNSYYENLEIVKETLFKKMNEKNNGTLIENKGCLLNIFKTACNNANIGKINNTKKLNKIIDEQAQKLSEEPILAEIINNTSEKKFSKLTYENLSPQNQIAYTDYMNKTSLLEQLNKKNGKKDFQSNDFQKLNFIERFYLFNFLSTKRYLEKETPKIIFQKGDEVEVCEFFTKNDLNFLRKALKLLNVSDIIQQYRDYNYRNNIDSTFFDFSNTKNHYFYALTHNLKNESLEDENYNEIQMFSKNRKNKSESKTFKNKVEVMNKLLNKLENNKHLPNWLKNNNIQDKCVKNKNYKKNYNIKPSNKFKEDYIKKSKQNQLDELKKNFINKKNIENEFKKINMDYENMNGSKFASDVLNLFEKSLKYSITCKKINELTEYNDNNY